MTWMKSIHFFFMLLFCLSTMAQELSTVLDETLLLKAEKFIGVDEFENLYYSNGNILYRKTPKKIFSYSNVELGRLTAVNIQNPFKIILFYADFNAVIILDNNLNELSEKIDFTQETLFNNVMFVTGSSQNNIWLYADDNKLHLYDYRHLSEVLQTQPITFYNSNFLPNKVTSTYKKVWILSENNIMEFNEYGVFTRSYAAEKADDIFPFQRGFIYTSEGSLFYQNQNERIPVLLDYENDLKSMYINKSAIYIYDGSKVYRYQIKQ